MLKSRVLFKGSFSDWDLLVKLKTGNLFLCEELLGNPNPCEKEAAEFESIAAQSLGT